MKITMVFKRAVDAIYAVCKGFSMGVAMAYRRSDKILNTLKKMKKFRMKYLGYSGIDAESGKHNDTSSDQKYGRVSTVQMGA